MGKNLSELGAEARREIGEESDKILLDKVRQLPGLTIYELSKELEWTKGRVQGSVNRLLEQNILRKKKVVLNDRILTKIFPTEYKESEVGVVEVNSEVVDPKLWKTHAFAGAMNRVLIKIVPEEMVDAITGKAFFYEKIPIEYRTSTVTFKLPQRLRDFYMLDNSILGVSTNVKGDAVLVTIEGTTAEVSVQNPNDILTAEPPEVLSTSNNSIKSELAKLDLRPIEIKIYMYLATEGQKKAKDISEYLHIRGITEIYHYLSALQHKGLVKGTLTHPIKFGAVPLSNALEKLRLGSS